MINKLNFKIYMYGYKGHSIPRIIRRLFAKSEFHRSWLSGYKGIFNEIK